MKNKFIPNFASLLNGIRSAYYRLGSNNIVENRDAVLRKYCSNGNQTAIALETLADSHVQACFDRLLEIMAFANPILETDRDIKINAEAADFIQNTYIKKFREVLIESLAVAKFTGVAGHENNYAINKKGQIIVKSITPIDSERLIYSIDNKGDFSLRIQTFNKPVDGEEPPLNKIVTFTYFSVYINSPYGLGIGSQLISLVKQKERLLELWLTIAERFSTPIKIGEIPENASPEEVDHFFDCFQDMSENAIFMLPTGFKLNVQDISATGADSLLKSLIEYCDEQISNLILGESLTGSGDLISNQSRDRVATKISERKALSLLNAISNQLTETTITWLVQMNYPEADIPKLKFVYEDDKSTLADRLEAAKRLGLQFDQKWAAEQLGIQLDKSPPKKSLGSGNIPTL